MPVSLTTQHAPLSHQGWPSSEAGRVALRWAHHTRKQPTTALELELTAYLLKLQDDCPLCDGTAEINDGARVDACPACIERALAGEP